MKVKYNGKKGLYFHNMDFYPGDVKEVSDDLDFSNPDFEILKEEKKAAKKAETKKKSDSKKSD